MQVLVVDDEVNVRFALERRLKSAGIRVQLASTAEQGMERARSTAFDAVLCDLKMPGGSGAKLVEWFASHSPTTWVFIMSAYVTDAVRAAFAHAPTVRVLDKPIDLDALTAQLREIGPRRGFFGRSIEVELFDYVQMIAVSGRDKRLVVATPRGDGAIWFEHGDIVHVEYGPYRGELAFYKMLAGNRGTFREALYGPPPRRTITCSSTHLLMEAARQMDEGSLGDEGPGVPEVVEDQASFADLAAQATPAEPAAPSSGGPGIDEDFVLPADDDETGSVAVAAAAEVLTDAPAVPSPADSVTGHAVVEDPEVRRLLLEQFWEYEGVDGVALVSGSGKVLAEDMRENGALVTLAGFYMRGAARIARTLGHNVYDGIVARARTGQQMIVVSMGGTSAVLSVQQGADPQALQDEILGVD